MSRSAETAGSIQRLLLRWLLSVFALLLVVGAVIDYADDALLMKTTFDRTLGDDLVAIAARVRAAREDPDAHVRALLRTKREGDETYYVVIGRDGKRSMGDLTLPILDVGNDKGIVYRYTSYRGHAVRVAAHRPKAMDAPALIEVAETLNGRHQAVLEAFLRDTAINLWMLILTSATAWLCVRHGLSSLRRLSDQVRSRPPIFPLCRKRKRPPRYGLSLLR